MQRRKPMAVCTLSLLSGTGARSISRKLKLTCWALFVVLVGTVPWALAQSTTADITGTVTDNTGATIPGAKVTLTDMGTRQTRDVQTGPTGNYTFTLLNPGTYSISISQPGFKSFVIPNITLAASDRAREDAKLTVGAAAETVQVTAQAPALQTDSSVLTNTVTSQQVQNLPLNGRNYINLAQIVPGANEGPPNGLTSGARPDDRRQTSSISVNGQSDVVNNEMVDGLDNNERVIGTIGIRPSVDAIRETTVESNEYTAEVGRTGGGVVNIITKSGTNAFHGSLYEFFQNEVLDAYPYQFGAHNAKPKNRLNQFGGSIGGPIVHDRTFFFADYEGLRQQLGTNPVASPVPTIAQYDALRSDPAALLPAGDTTLDQVGLQYARLFPLPNAPTTTPGYGEFVSSPVVTRNSDTVDARVDHRFNQNNLFYARYTYNRVPSNFPGLLPTVNEAGLNIAPGGAVYNFYGAAKDDAQQAQLNFVHTFTPNLLMELKFGYTRINNQSYPLNYGVAVNSAFGQPNVNLDQITSGLAPLSSSGYADLGDGSYIPIIDIDNTYQYNGAITWNKGAHTIKMGASLIRRQALNLQNNQGIGDWSFQTPANTAPSPLYPTGTTALASVLAGQFTSVQRSNNLVPPNYRVWEPSAFFEDDWHAASNLTLNLGVRYDIFTPFAERHNAISNFDPATASIAIANQNGVNQYAGLNPTFTNLAPRVGFAFTPRPSWVIRGGFGISYFPMNYTSNSNLKNQPFVSSFSCNNGACPGGYTRLAQGLPIPTAASATNPSGSIADAIDPAFRTSYLEQFNLTLERDLAGNVLQATYVGELGRHMAQVYADQNTPGPVSNSTLDAMSAASGGKLTTAQAFNTLRPYYSKLPNVTSIGGFNSRGSSSYNALQLSVTRRTRAGLTLEANYTFAHNLDNFLGISNEINDGYGAIPSRISQIEYGNSDMDIRSRGVVTGDYALPFGRNLHGVSGVLAKGWQANTLLVWETGFPFTVTNSVDVITTTNGANSDRPDQLRSAKVNNPSVLHAFDTAAFQPQASGTLGTESRNPLYGPHFRHVDLSVFKDFPIYRESTLEFRAECFNIVNAANFNAPNHTLQIAPVSNPDGTPSDSYAVQANNIGTITSMSPNYTPREFQFALKYQF
jgi:hypothetical protein